jgi:hypothetical protein
VRPKPVRTKVLSSLWTGYSKALAVYGHVATQHESEAIDIPSHRPYYNWIDDQRTIPNTYNRYRSSQQSSLCISPVCDNHCKHMCDVCGLVYILRTKTVRIRYTKYSTIVPTGSRPYTTTVQSTSTTARSVTRSSCRSSCRSSVARAGTGPATYTDVDTTT